MTSSVYFIIKAGEATPLRGVWSHDYQLIEQHARSVGATVTNYTWLKWHGCRIKVTSRETNKSGLTQVELDGTVFRELKTPKFKVAA